MVSFRNTKKLNPPAQTLLMANERSSYWLYLWKTAKWMIGNAIFGIFPLLFMCSVYYISEEKLGKEEINTLVYEGAILFVCIAIVGSVLVDFFLSGFRPNGFPRFAIYIFPLIILFIISINYFLIHIKIIDKSRFSLSSGTTIVTVILSVIYILFVKTNLYMKEDLRHEPNL